jgi:hypothetical protein
VVDDTRPGQASAYLEHLPAVFREGAEPGRPPFLGRFLLAFEHLLTGLGDPAEPGLDELLDRVPDYFAVPLYRLRGTKRGMEALIRLFTGGLAPTITEVSVPLQLGRTSTIGLDTQIGGGAPHYFHVLLRLSQPDPVERRRVEALVRSVIDVEKPAHTRYRLDVITPSLQVGHSHVGVDTLLSPS